MFVARSLLVVGVVCCCVDAFGGYGCVVCAGCLLFAPVLVCFALCIVRCLLFVGCCMLFVCRHGLCLCVGRCLLRIIHCVCCVVCSSLFVACCLLIHGYCLLFGVVCCSLCVVGLLVFIV